MSRYSVADAKNGLSSLIDNALAGDEVIITRHGKPVAEIRPIRPAISPTNAYAALKTFRDAGPALDITTVELLRQMYEDDPV
jgi:prevent-host-death family protein